MRLRLPRPATLQAIAIGVTGFSSIAWFPGVGAPYSRFACTLVAAAVWMVVWAAGGLERISDRQRRVFLLLLALAAVIVVVSSARSRFPQMALTFGGATSVSAPYWISLLAIIGLASRVTLGPATLRALRWQFAWGLPVAVIGIVQALLQGSVTIGFRNVDYFAPMMLLFAPLALGLATMSEHRRGWWKAAAAVFVIAVLCARTVSGLLGLAAEMLFLVTFAPGLLGISRRLRTVVIAALATGMVTFAVVGALYLADALPEPAREAATHTVFGASAATRIEMWRVAAAEIRHHLATGVGPDQYAFEGQRLFSKRLFRLEYSPQPDVELPVDPHSLIILLPVDFGLLGLLATLLIAATWARGVLRPPFKTPEGFQLRWSFALGALGFGYATLFTPFPLLFGGMPLLLAGLALVRPPGPRPWPRADRYAVPRWAAAAAAVFVAVAIGGAAVTGWYVSGVHNVVTDVDSGVIEASRLQPRVAYYHYARLWQEGRVLARRSEPDAYVAYQREVDAAPLEIRGYAPYLVELVRLSIDQATNTGRVDLAWELERLEDAERISPDLPEVDVERAHALIAAGDVVAARQALDATAEWRAVIPVWMEYQRLLGGLEP